jgi:hypothetical protein
MSARKDEMDRFKSKAKATPLPADDKVIHLTPTPTKGKKHGFAVVPLRTAAEISKRRHKVDFAVLIVLIYLASFKRKSKTFTISNDIMTIHGIKRAAKHRALARLEREGLIRVERYGRRAPIVTLLFDL